MLYVPQWQSDVASYCLIVSQHFWAESESCKTVFASKFTHFSNDYSDRLAAVRHYLPDTSEYGFKDGFGELLLNPHLICHLSKLEICAWDVECGRILSNHDAMCADKLIGRDKDRLLAIPNPRDLTKARDLYALPASQQ
jgi:hypothetical protein